MSVTASMLLCIPQHMLRNSTLEAPSESLVALGPDFTIGRGTLRWGCFVT